MDKFYKTIFQNSSIGQLIFDLEGRILEANNALVQILGSPSIEATKQINILTYPLLVNAGISGKFQKVLETGKSIVFESSYTSKWGKSIWFKIHADPLFNEDNVLEGVYSFVEDITVNKLIEESLHKIEERYKIITENISDGVWLMDMNFNTKWISPSISRDRGFTLEEISGMSMYENMPPESLKLSTMQFIEKLNPIDLYNPEKTIVVRGQYEYYCKNGSTIWGDSITTLIRDSAGKPIGFLGVSRNIDAQKKAEKAIQESEKKYRQLVDLINEGILCVDMKGNINFINPGFADILQYSPEEIMNRDIIYFMADKKKTELADYINLKNKVKENQDYELIRKDGQKIYVSISTSPLNDDAGNITGFMIVVTDITDRKIAEEKIHKSEEMLRTITNGMLDLVSLIKIDGIYEYVSPSYTKNLGYTSEELIGKSAFDFLHPDDRKKIMDFLNERLSLGVGSTQYRYRHKDGHYNWLEATGNLIRDNQGNPSKIVIASRDITTRKIIEDALKLAQFSIDNASDPIFWFTRDMRFFYVNNAACNHLKYTKEELLNMSLKDISSNLKVNPQIFQEVKEKGVLTIESEHKDKNGNSLPVEVTLNYFEYEGKEMMFSFIHNIIARKESEKALIESKDAAEKANKSKSDFLANMSHEIRTPLNAIIGFTDLIITEEDQPEKLDMLKLIKQSGNALLNIINDILDFSNIEAGKINIIKEKFNMYDTIEHTVNTLNSMAEIKGLFLKYDIAPQIIEDPYFIGDEPKLKQILINLINNAVKFTETGGIYVCVDIKEQVASKFQIEFKIKDTGIGIQKNLVSKIFNQFVQAEHYLTKKYKGTGLGLAIVNRLIKLMDGTIDVISSLGNGTEFILSIPFESASVLPENEFITDGFNMDSEFKNINILAAEDDMVNQVLMKSLAKKYNINLEIAENGEEAINLLTNRDFDIILMDIMMPVMDGAEATRKIRAGEAGEKKKDIPIVALTAHAMKEQHTEFINIGMDYVIVKPVDAKELLYLIRKFCRACN